MRGKRGKKPDSCIHNVLHYCDVVNAAGKETIFPLPVLKKFGNKNSSGLVTIVQNASKIMIICWLPLRTEIYFQS